MYNNKVNNFRLIGRIKGDPISRTNVSYMKLMVFRGHTDGTPFVDVFNVFTTNPSTQKDFTNFKAGELVVVEGFITCGKPKTKYFNQISLHAVSIQSVGHYQKIDDSFNFEKISKFTEEALEDINQPE